MDLLSLQLTDQTIAPRRDETYEEYLNRCGVLDQGFGFREIVRKANWRGKYTDPPRDLWSRMGPTLAVANMLRMRMVNRGAKGLRVAAAYRPRGGASRSQHKVNAALDLDLLPSDYDLTGAYYEAAVDLWCEIGADCRMGLGLYCKPGRRGGIRVHVDTGYRARSWQIYRGTVKPHHVRGRWRGVAYAIANERMRTVPGE